MLYMEMESLTALIRINLFFYQKQNYFATTLLSCISTFRAHGQQVHFSLIQGFQIKHV